MWNVKCENARHVQNNVTIVSNCWICCKFNCKHLFTVNNLDIILFNLKMSEFVFFLVDFRQVSYEIVFVWKYLFHFLVVVHQTFLQETM